MVNMDRNSKEFEEDLNDTLHEYTDEILRLNRALSNEQSIVDKMAGENERLRMMVRNSNGKNESEIARLNGWIDELIDTGFQAWRWATTPKWQLWNNLVDRIRKEREKSN